MSATPSAARKAEALLRRYALRFPESHEDFPWGERVVKVRKKVFVFMGVSNDGLSLSVKLPESQTIALILPFAVPTGYGLGGSGWVTATFAPGEHPPTDMLREWIEESYRAIAPKKLSLLIDGDPPPWGVESKRAPRGRAKK